MCPAHRSAVLEDTLVRLRAEEPTRLVSTQLIEAGVDIDFPCCLPFASQGSIRWLKQLVVATAKADMTAAGFTSFAPMPQFEGAPERFHDELAGHVRPHRPTDPGKLNFG